MMQRFTIIAVGFRYAKH